jgi:hypothetical protein
MLSFRTVNEIVDRGLAIHPITTVRTGQLGGTDSRRGPSVDDRGMSTQSNSNAQSSTYLDSLPSQPNVSSTLSSLQTLHQSFAANMNLSPAITSTQSSVSQVTANTALNQLDFYVTAQRQGEIMTALRLLADRLQQVELQQQRLIVQMEAVKETVIYSRNQDLSRPTANQIAIHVMDSERASPGHSEMLADPSQTSEERLSLDDHPPMLSLLAENNIFSDDIVLQATSLQMSDAVLFLEDDSFPVNVVPMDETSVPFVEIDDDNSNDMRVADYLRSKRNLKGAASVTPKRKKCENGNLN